MTHTPFGLDSAEITGGAISGHHALVILLRMLCAFVLGAIVVIVIGALAFRYFRSSDTGTELFASL